MDAVIISNNFSRMSITLKLLLPYFHINVVSPIYDQKQIHNYYDQYKRLNDSQYGNPFKQISLTLTHLHIWDKADTFTSNKYLYIFEDDAIPHKNITECTLRDMENQSVPIFYLGTCAAKRHGEDTTHSCSTTFKCSSLCLHAYAVHTKKSKSLAHKVLQWSHFQALRGHSLYRYNLDVKLRGYTDHGEKSICLKQDIFGQQKWGSTSGHSKCCAW